MSTADVAFPQELHGGKGSIRGDLRDLRRYRSLVWHLFSSGLQTERTGSIFGFVWWLLDPILLMFVYLFLFDFVFHRSEPDFPVYILVSLVSWEFFQKSLDRSISTTISASESMRQVRFPKSVIPISTTLTQFTHLLFGLAVSVVVARIGWGVHPSLLGVLGLLPLAILQGIFTLGLAFLLSGLNFFFRDVQHLLRYVLRTWYLTSPGLWTLTRIPPAYRGVFQLNPFAPFFESYHALVLHTAGPPLWALGYVTGLSVFLLVGSYALYARLSPHFVKLVD